MVFNIASHLIGALTSARVSEDQHWGSATLGTPMFSYEWDTAIGCDSESCLSICLLLVRL